LDAEFRGGGLVISLLVPFILQTFHFHLHAPNIQDFIPKHCGIYDEEIYVAAFTIYGIMAYLFCMLYN
jgi:hypothetical protein